MRRYFPWSLDKVLFLFIYLFLTYPVSQRRFPCVHFGCINGYAHFVSVVPVVPVIEISQGQFSSSEYYAAAYWKP